LPSRPDPPKPTAPPPKAAGNVVPVKRVRKAEPAADARKPPPAAVRPVPAPAAGGKGDATPARTRAARAARIAALSQRLGDRPTAVTWLERALAAAPDDRALAARLAELKAG
jgi:hypothetical protein